MLGLVAGLKTYYQSVVCSINNATDKNVQLAECSQTDQQFVTSSSVLNGLLTISTNNLTPTNLMHGRDGRSFTLIWFDVVYRDSTDDSSKTQEQISKQLISFTDMYYPQNIQQDHFCCLPYGLILQPFNKFKVENAYNHYQKLIRCQRCNAVINCYSEIMGIQQCPFCKGKLSFKPQYLPIDELQDFEDSQDVVVSVKVVFLIDITSDKGIELINFIIDEHLLEKLQKSNPNIHVAFIFFNNYVHYLNVTSAQHYELISYICDENLECIPYKIPMLKSVLFCYQYILTSVQFQNQLLELIINEERQIIQSLYFAKRLLAFNCFNHDQQRYFDSCTVFMVAFGPDSSINANRNQQDYDASSKTYNQEALLSMMPSDQVKNTFKSVKTIEIEFVLFFQTRQFVDAANYTWMCNKAGSFNLYEDDNIKCFNDLSNEIQQLNNKVYNVKMNIRTTLNGYCIKNIIGPGALTSKTSMQCCIFNKSQYLAIVLEINEKHAQINEAQYIQFVINYIDNIGASRIRIITAQLQQVSSPKELIQHYNVLPKLLLIQSICAYNAEPVISSQNKQQLELSFGYIAFQNELVSKIPVFVRNIYKLIMDEEDKTLSLTQLLRGIFNILHTPIFKKNLKNFDMRLLCVHKSMCSTLEQAINIIIPVILICPIFNQQMQDNLKQIQQQNNIQQFNKYTKMYYVGYADMGILKENSQFAQCNGYNLSSLAVMLNRKQTRLLIVVDDRDQNFDCITETTEIEMEFTDHQSSNHSQSLHFSRFSNSVGTLAQDSNNTLRRDSCDSAPKEINFQFGLSKYSSRLSVLAGKQFLADDSVDSDSTSDSNINLNQVGKQVRFQKLSNISTKQLIQHRNQCLDDSSTEKLACDILNGLKDNQKQQLQIKQILKQPNVKTAIKTLQKRFRINAAQISILFYSKHKDAVQELMYENGNDGIDEWIETLFNFTHQ